jgi:hypothetical protein
MLACNGRLGNHVTVSAVALRRAIGRGTSDEVG